MAKKIFFIALISWLAVEIAHQLYLSQKYCKEQFNWSSYAYDRNRQRIDQLYTVSNTLLKTPLFIEIRNGAVKDSTGFIANPLKKLLLKLAEDIEPAGHFYYRFTPVQKRLGSVPIAAECITQLPSKYVGICNCLDFVQPTGHEGVILQLSTDQNSRLGPSNRLEYDRSSNNSFSRALRASPCFSAIDGGGYLKIEKNEPSSFPLRYNSKHWDLLIWKLF